jgi:hypothetical protein
MGASRSILLETGPMVKPTLNREPRAWHWCITTEENVKAKDAI